MSQPKNSGFFHHHLLQVRGSMDSSLTALAPTPALCLSGLCLEFPVPVPLTIPDNSAVLA